MLFQTPCHLRAIGYLSGVTNLAPARTPADLFPCFTLGFRHESDKLHAGEVLLRSRKDKTDPAVHQG